LIPCLRTYNLLTVTRIKSDKRSEEVNEKTVDFADKEGPTKKRSREDDGAPDEAPPKRVDQKEEVSADAS
jgi:hypothetical protein